MEEAAKNGEKKITEVTTFSVPFASGKIKKNLTINTNTPSQPSKEEIISQAFKFHSQGNISEATKYYQYFINQGFKDHRVFSNYGTILKDLGQLKEAEIYTRKVIELNPNDPTSHYNLGNLMIELGKLKEGEISYRKAIELKPDFGMAYYNLGNVLKKLGKRENALDYFYKAIDLLKDKNLCLATIGELLLEQGDYAEGVIKIKKGAGAIQFDLKNGLSII
ncbi:hypothetical protein DNJ72_00240 [Prochlorococcus marinus XMU1403]|nr:tetratricopeptide repeat protein [Prochlorococcus marinus]MBW3048498.1 hypothetical protein [Prochlorococcus marinus str. MU1403]PYE03964.1 hypothetical protein DNJ72_00240 [Prochlorococcus marinus XMU1403]